MHRCQKFLVVLLILLGIATGSAQAQQRMPELNEATAWLNSPPLTRADLRGKVVLIDFWTYSCINCLRSLPYIKAWEARYRNAGLVVIGVHSPEFDFERDPARIERALKRYGIHYPIAVDGKMGIWNAFGNQYWPAHYLVDRTGHIRYHHFGEGKYQETEAKLRELLAEDGSDPGNWIGAPAHPDHAEEVASNWQYVASPETYIGSFRAERFLPAGSLTAWGTKDYTAPRELGLNNWALVGRWSDHSRFARLEAGAGTILFRYQARDLHMVLGAGSKPVSFQVLIDGQEPGANHGADCDEHGYGVITEERLYQLVREKQPGAPRNFSIHFFDAGLRAFSFTFG